MDAFQFTAGQREVLGTQDYSPIPARPSQTMLHESLSLKTYLVAFGDPYCVERDWYVHF